MPDAGDSDETFAFIAGYTEGGAPYGIAWDDADAMANEAGILDAARPGEGDDIPF
jgi:hypothetical protein